MCSLPLRSAAAAAAGCLVMGCVIGCPAPAAAAAAAAAKPSPLRGGAGGGAANFEAGALV